MKFHLLVWLVSSVFIIHDFEEIIVVEKWLLKNEKELLMTIPIKFHNYFNRIFPKKSSVFACAVLVEYIGLLGCIFLSIFNHYHEWSIIGILGVVSILFLHSFTHIGQMVVLKRYTPGVWTAIFVVIPFSVYFYDFVLPHDIVHWKLIGLSIPAGFVLVPCLNQFGLWLGKKIEF